ncbi:MAG: hypothetical protein KIB50_03190 [Ureaplasma parvum]|uniref:Lipoprotein n=3 Tax=Ureaplasma parvum TaxID=134821 RepID=A0AAC9X6L2_UREPR|nr:hypothetical protein [Ureaplasma parvum]pir/A82889/ hypothetical protein UU443 [imported] - Ureaplasma urealyticum [Ureaplasma urealyticum]AAF30855.1 unique hypothetical membrane lipoprotein [Ureaplasma parvum serovar 3 str. ATCC 700970]ACA32798.1 putative lipoprotein [Ureaplasma parvum serovar 3 str. ATCC 27815]ASD24788.1 hypothetical protein CEG38_02750 [Ureaplasma parvum]ASD24939.1 hypothetical protein CEE64_00375 [Ureaplasma parvum]ASD30107.1 hypothetical protein CEG42_02690 [Ureaplasm
MKHKKYKWIWLKLSMISAIPLLATIITACAKVDTKQKAKEELQSSLNKAVLLKEIVDQSSYEDFKKIYNQTLKSNLENINKLSEQKLKQEQQTIKNLITQVSVLNELDSIKNMSDLIDVVELENTKKQLQDFLNQYEKLLNQASVDTTIIDKLKSDAHQKRLHTKALIQKTILDLANKIKNLIKTSGSNKNIVEIESDIQKLVNNNTKANFKKLYEDFKLIYTKLNDINDLINKELKALPFIKKLDDIVNVINTIYQQNYSFLWFDQLKLTNLKQNLNKNITNIVNVKKSLDIEQIKSLTNKLLNDLQNYLQGLNTIALDSENSINKLISIIQSLKPDDYNPYYSIEKQQNIQKDKNNSSKATYNGLENQIENLQSIISLFSFNTNSLTIDSANNLNNELTKKFEDANTKISSIVDQIKQTILSNFKKTYLFKDFIKHLKEFNTKVNSENDQAKKTNKTQTIQDVLNSYKNDPWINTKVSLKLSANQTLTIDNLENIDLAYSNDFLLKPKELINYLKLDNNQERVFTKDIENFSVKIFTIVDKKLYIPEAKELIEESKKITETKNGKTNNESKVERLKKFTKFVEQGINNNNVSSYTLDLYNKKLKKLIEEVKKIQNGTSQKIENNSK